LLGGAVAVVFGPGAVVVHRIEFDNGDPLAVFCGEDLAADETRHLSRLGPQFTGQFEVGFGIFRSQPVAENGDDHWQDFDICRSDLGGFSRV
jgi:hypothetical protein